MASNMQLNQILIKRESKRTIGHRKNMCQAEYETLRQIPNSNNINIKHQKWHLESSMNCNNVAMREASKEGQWGYGQKTLDNKSKDNLH